MNRASDSYAAPEAAKRLFGSLVESRRDRSPHGHFVALQIAIMAHALVFCFILVQHWLSVPPIAEPPLQVSFAHIAEPPPPPPPPPPPAPPKPVTPKVVPKVDVPPPTEMVEPIEMPEIIMTDPIPEDTLEVGVEGGVEGGVPGGVLGGVPGGTPSGPYRLGGPATPPVLFHQVQPTYPPRALAARMQGVVRLEAIIRKDGTVGEIQTVKPLPMGLTEAAIDAVRQWRYKPGELNGTPVEFSLMVEVRFRL